jgi:hypothetical protein
MTKMNFKIIKGRFYVVGYSPDGDSMRFQAYNNKNWNFFNWGQAANKKSKRKQLRFEGIDALETHYAESHQPHSFGIAAMEVLLSLLGIDQVVYNLSLTQIYSANDGKDGFIASESLDVYDRPVSLVFTGDAPLHDGDEIPLASLPLDYCVNFKMMKVGLVYPTFYSTMEDDLLNLFTEIATSCRDTMVGLWALDKTSDFTIWNTSTITDDIVILPKLFRRLTSFIQYGSDFSQLKAYLAKQGDKVQIRSTGKTAKLVDLMQINNRNIKFPYKPEDLIFDPKG